MWSGRRAPAGAADRAAEGPCSGPPGAPRRRPDDRGPRPDRAPARHRPRSARSAWRATSRPLPKASDEVGQARGVGMRSWMSTEVEPEDYAALNAAYAVLLTGVVLATRERATRDPVRPEELLPLGAATFAVAKVVARERIGTWV